MDTDVILKKFAIDLLNEAAEECEQRFCVLSESEQKRDLFLSTADKLTDIMELFVESYE